MHFNKTNSRCGALIKKLISQLAMKFLAIYGNPGFKRISLCLISIKLYD